MASSYTSLGTELMTTGENAGTWGTTTNTNLQIIEQISGGYVEQSIAGGTQTTTLSVSDGSTGATLGHRIIKFTGTITGNQTVTIPLDVQQMYVLVNGTSGAYTVNFKYVSGSGSSVTFAATDKGTKLVYATADHATNPNLVDSGIASTGDHDLDGNEFILDADADTSITADTDDQIDIKIAGADDFQFTANTFTAQAGSTIAAQALTATTVTASGILKTDDTTEATSTTDGSLQTDGGLSVAKDAVIGDDLKLLSDSAVLSFGADSDVSLTHVADTALLLNAAMRLQFRDSGLYVGSNADGDLDIVSDGTAVDSINLESAGGITLDAGTAGSGIVYEDDGTEMLRVHNSSSDVIVESKVSNKDIIFKVNDGGSSTEVARFDGDVSAFLLASGKKLMIGAAEEYISGDGTDISFTVGSGGDINIGQDIGVTFGDDGEKIEGDGTNLTILSSGDLNLAAGGTTNQIKVTDGAVLPITDDDVDLGSSSYQFKDAYFDGTLEADAITVGGTAVLTGGAETAITSLYNASLAIGYGASHANIDFSTDNSIIFDIDGTQQITLADGVLKPVTDNDIDLGTSSLEFKDAYFDGTVTTDALTVSSTTNLDGAIQVDNTITVGVDDTGYDVKMFGDTASRYWLWDTSADGVVQRGTLTVGVDDTGHDVKLFGATSGSFLLWDESDDALELTDSSPIKIGDGGDMQIYHDGSNSYITNSQGALKLATETSGIAITLGHSTSEVTVADNLTVTGDLTVNGTTTTVNSTTVTIDDPIFTLGGDTAPGSDDNKDRGIEFRYHDGSSARIGFMGYDDSAEGFAFLTAASNSSEVFSGTAAKLIAGELDISGNMDIDGTSNLDAVDIDGAVQIDGTLTTGVDDTGVDVKFFGATSGSFLLWDESADSLLLTDSTPLKIGDSQDLTLYHDGSNSYITNAVGALKIATETSGIAVTIGHTTSETTIADNATVTGNLSVGGNFDVTGTIDLSDSDFTNAGDIQLDSITGDGDTNTSITFSGSDVITITTGGETQFTFNNGSILPTTDNDIDLGSGSYEFKDGYFDGTLHCDVLDLNGTEHTTIEDPTALAIALG